MTAAETIQALIGFAGLLIGGVSARYIYQQLCRMAEANQQMIEANKIANAMNVITLEQAIADTRAELAEVAQQIASFGATGQLSEKETATFQAAKLRLQERLEQYLNFVDRLCSYIVRGLIDEEDYRQDYRPWLAETVQKYKDRFGPDTRHRNILKAHQAWSEDKSVKERR